jgi:prepilin-type N-terminal cleavage/methylation domain-containing protein
MKLSAIQTRNRAFTLIELVVVCVLIGLLAVIAVPSFIKARANAQKRACIANLRAVDGAKQMWLTDNFKAITVVPTATNLAPYFGTKVMPVCPGGGTYTIRQGGVFPTCTLQLLAGHQM